MRLRCVPARALRRQANKLGRRLQIWMRRFQSCIVSGVFTSSAGTHCEINRSSIHAALEEPTNWCLKAAARCQQKIKNNSNARLKHTKSMRFVHKSLENERCAKINDGTQHLLKNRMFTLLGGTCSRAAPSCRPAAVPSCGAWKSRYLSIV